MPPPHWPSDVRYISTYSYHSSVSQPTRTFLTQGEDAVKAVLGLGSPSLVAIRRITESIHPACGQFGLFAAR
jgi:hypothetical protein